MAYSPPSDSTIRFEHDFEWSARMISSVRGTVLAIGGNNVVIEVGGIGLSIQITPRHALALRVGNETTIRTALIVREDDLSLYGFVESDELEIFDLLRGVSGVGPKSAMGVLAVLAPSEIAVAVATEDDGAFRTVSGIGPKTAKLIVVSLAGKVKVSAAAAKNSPRTSSVNESVLVALVGLGWPERVAMQAVEDAVAGASEADLAAVPNLLRLALANLGPQQFAGSSQ